MNAGRSSAWLLLALAACAGDSGDRAGGPPSGEPPATVWFEEASREWGLEFRYESGHAGRYLFPEIAGGGVALFDMDGDDDLDAFFVQGGRVLDSRGATARNKLFRNDGARFVDVSADSGVEIPGYGMGCATGDFDGDGDVDLYVTRLGRNLLLANDGAGRFEDVTERAGVGDFGWGTSASFWDFDADGDLDLFLVNYVRWSEQTEKDCKATSGRLTYCGPKSYAAPQRDVLYENLGGGRFADVTESSGIAASFGNGLGVACGDFDLDGREDVFVANDGSDNQLWLQKGPWKFEDCAALFGCSVDANGLARAGMGTDTEDVDADGDLDLLVVHLRGETDGLFRNEDGRYFKEVTSRAGLAPVSRPFTRFGMGFADFDSDGTLDVYVANGRVTHYEDRITEEGDPFEEPNLLLKGTRDGRYEEVMPRGGTSPELVATSRGLALGDVDGDGAIDVVIVNRDGLAHLLLNRRPDRGAWILVRAESEGRDAHGARLRIEYGERAASRLVKSSVGYCSASDPRVHFGLGDDPGVVHLEVRWPDGTTERFPALETNQRVRVRRGEGL